MSDDWKLDIEEKCRGCRDTGHVYYRLVECGDGAYTDEQYRCDACGKTWWVEGADY